MCAYLDLYTRRVYLPHAYYPGAYHRAGAKRARLLMEQHRRDCPECRAERYGHTNYNLVEPPPGMRQINKRMPKEGR